MVDNNFFIVDINGLVLWFTICKVTTNTPNHQIFHRIFVNLKVFQKYFEIIGLFFVCFQFNFVLLHQNIITDVKPLEAQFADKQRDFIDYL
jgi:hypothetical protein